MAMLHLLAERLPPARLAVAHVNHRTRGAASDADEAFVRRQARILGLRFLASRLPRRAGRSEADLREARYAALARLAARAGASAVAVAHTADDQAETVLLRAARGTGLSGLAGMRPSRPFGRLRLIRPLLACRRDDLRRYLRRRRLAHREDAGNRRLDPARNRVRHRVMPSLRRINPRVEEALVRLAARAGEASAFLEAEALRSVRAWRRRGRARAASVAAARGVPAALRAGFWEAGCGAPLSAGHVAALDRLLAIGRGRVALPGRKAARVSRGRVIIGP